MDRTARKAVGGVRVSYRELTVAAFAAAVAAPRPAPAGGVAAATTAALGAGLVAMTAGLSQAHRADAGEIAVRADALRERALTLADEDAAAYGAVLAAYRLSRDAADPAHVPGRKERITGALRRACEVPLEIVAVAADVAALAADVGMRGNPHLTGDAATAAHLAVAAARSAATLIRINARLGDLGPEPITRAAERLAAAEAAAGRLAGVS